MIHRPFLNSAIRDFIIKIYRTFLYLVVLQLIYTCTDQMEIRDKYLVLC